MSENLKAKEKMEKTKKPDTNRILSDLRNKIWIQRQNPILAYIEKFDEYFKKKKRFLKNWEILFDIWNDSNIYIVKSWIILIYSYMADWDRKEIFKTREGWFIWEWIIFWRNIKDVEAVSFWFSEVYPLNLDDLKKIEIENPTEAIEIYKYIIEITNKRLLDTSKELASIYDATNKIMEFAKTGENWFIDIILYMKNLLKADYIIYVENHQLVDWLFFYKYNTILKKLGPINKKAWKEITKDLSWIISSKDFYRQKPTDNIFALPLKTGEKLKWFFLIWKQNEITDNEIRIWNNLWFLLGSIIESNQEKKEQKAIQMSKNVFDNSIS